MSLYEITAPRSTLALYLAKEFGIQRAARMMSGLEKKTPFLYNLPREVYLMNLYFPQPFMMKAAFKTKRAAEKVAAKIRFIAAYQQGRLGKRLSDPFVHVTRLR